MEGKSGDRKDRQASKQAGSAGRWIWQVRRAAVLAVQEGQRTRGATTDLDGCDRESILIVFFSFSISNFIPSAFASAPPLCDKCCSSGGRCRPTVTAAAHATSSPGLGAPQCDLWWASAGRHLGASSPKHHGRRRLLSLQVATSLTRCLLSTLLFMLTISTAYACCT